MNQKKYIVEYYDFMTWFKGEFPDLYGKYWSNILMPLDESGVGVTDRSMKDEVYEKMVDIIYSYYYPL